MRKTDSLYPFLVIGKPLCTISDYASYFSFVFSPWLFFWFRPLAQRLFYCKANSLASNDKSSIVFLFSLSFCLFFFFVHVKCLKGIMQHYSGPLVRFHS